MILEEYLTDDFNLPKNLIEELIRSGKQKIFAKNELILAPFQPSREVYFIEEGLAKMFYDKDARSVTHSFVAENQFIGRSDVFLENSSKRNNQYGLMALENNTVVYQLSFSKIKSLAKTSLEMNKLIQAILLHHLRNFSNRLSNLQFENAAERYKLLMDATPEIILRASLGDIASYLGISQQTLSVIRSQVE